MRKKLATKENIAPEITHIVPWRLTQVKPLADYCLEVEFNDGAHGIVEMENLILGQNAGVFAALKDQAVFKKVSLEYGAVTWPGELDLAPDAMHTEIKKNGCWVLR